MQVIDKKKEREQALQERWEKERQIKREQELSLQQAREQNLIIDISKGTFNLLKQAMQNGGLTRVYGHEMTGGYFYFPDQMVSAHKFLELSIRDRNLINELIVEEHNPRDQDIELNLQLDRETILILDSEARKLGLNYITYVRAIFHTRLLMINQEQREIEGERQRAELHDVPKKIEGLITKELRDKLEGKYGKPKYNALFGIQTYGWFDMLIELAEEYFEAKTVKRK